MAFARAYIHRPDQVFSDFSNFEERFERWTERLENANVHERLVRIAMNQFHKEPTASTLYSQDLYNRTYRVNFWNREDVLVRFPMEGRSVFKEKKFWGETASMQYIEKKTSIPVPKVLGEGKTEFGPYVILELIEGKPLSEYLKVPEGSQSVSGPGVDVLNPYVDIATLRRAYRSMAVILLKLSEHHFSKIGNLSSDKSGDFSVGRRPITLNGNKIVTLGNVQPGRLSDPMMLSPVSPPSLGPFLDATTYLISLADHHILHLTTRCDNAIKDEDDCRKKFIARCLFRQIAAQFSQKYKHGPFMLFCDDFHPSNILVDEDLRVKGVVDWGFTYSAPAEFTYCSPQWLLLCRPESWDAGLDDFLFHYEARLKIFLDMLRGYEDDLAKHKFPLDKPRLSEHMRRSFDSGDFWVILAATSSYAFDEIFWKFVYPRYYGHLLPGLNLEVLLSEREQDRIESFVDEKMKHLKEHGYPKNRITREMLDDY